MTSHLENIRARLQTERRRLADELQSKLSQSAAEVHEGSPFGKREETATESSELGSRVAAVRLVREQLVEMERALEKLAAGTYGLCDSCGKPIPPARLEAIPQATLCLECKSSQLKSGGR